MILYYSTKFHFVIINSFRVIGRGHFPPPPPPNLPLKSESRATLKKPRPNRVKNREDRKIEAWEQEGVVQTELNEIINPIPPGLFEGGAAWGRGGGGGGRKCPRPITLKLLMIMKWNLVE